RSEIESTVSIRFGLIHEAVHHGWHQPCIPVLSNQVECLEKFKAVSEIVKDEAEAVLQEYHSEQRTASAECQILLQEYENWDQHGGDSKMKMAMIYSKISCNYR
ncbi:hypothetical protein CBL_21503, partial [Carabus blaptoides fortunei]